MITTTEAHDMVAGAVRRIVPDADLDAVPPDADLRQTFELDSLDFLSFVELLAQQSGIRIDEDDYPELRSLRTCTAFLQSRSGS